MSLHHAAALVDNAGSCRAYAHLPHDFDRAGLSIRGIPSCSTRAIATAGDGSRLASFSRRAAQYRSAEGVNPLPCENIGAV